MRRLKVMALWYVPPAMAAGTQARTAAGMAQQGQVPGAPARTVKAVGLGLVLVANVVGCDGTMEDTATGPIGDTAQGVYGGYDTVFPPAVAVRTTQCTQSPWHCGGLLISPTTVLTAAHCLSYPAGGSHPNGVDPTLASTFSVATNCQDITDPSCVWTTATLAETWTPYSPGSAFDDIGVLHLSTPTTVAPTRLMNMARLSEVKAGDLVLALGRGYTETGLSPVLKGAFMPVIQVKPDEEYMQIGWLESPPSSLGSGDSGGPVLIKRDNEWFSVGVTCSGGQGVPSISTLVPSYFDWVLSRSTDIPAQSYLPSAQIMTIL